jgi:hypothetical protein
MTNLYNFDRCICTDKNNRCEKGNKQEKIFREENNVKIVLQNNKKKVVDIWKIDGCVITTNDQKKCDYLFEVFYKNKIENILFVELKHLDWKIGILQLENTIEILKDRYVEFKGNKKAILVSRQIPAKRLNQVDRSNFKQKTRFLLSIITDKNKINYKKHQIEYTEII